jgi:hypothetical protein
MTTEERKVKDGEIIKKERNKGWWNNQGFRHNQDGQSNQNGYNQNGYNWNERNQQGGNMKCFCYWKGH